MNRIKENLLDSRDSQLKQNFFTYLVWYLPITKKKSDLYIEVCQIDLK